jgi:Delta24-sterol reductase
LFEGYTLAVTLEIGDATLGGLAMGVGMTTHSHKVCNPNQNSPMLGSMIYNYDFIQVGLYQETVTAYEIVLGDGSHVRATEKDNEDLFRALPWSHGSLGFLVALELKLVKVKVRIAKRTLDRFHYLWELNAS